MTSRGLYYLIRALVTLVAKTLVEWQMRRETAMLDSVLPNENTDQISGKSS